MSLAKYFSDDGGQRIEWGRTSADYAQHRPNYPLEFYQRLADRGIGLPGQRILDLGTGVGFLAQQFASQGARVVGIDIDPDQIATAKRRAEAAGVDVDYCQSAAENTGLADASFEVVTASQCWLYFDRVRASREVIRLLRPNGRLVTCHFCWLPCEDDVARRSEELVLKFNPKWTGAGYRGEVSRDLPERERFFTVADFFLFDAAISFTRDSWRGRFRACRGIGASLPPEQVEEFDRKHTELLKRTVPETFTVLHRIDCHILHPMGGVANGY